jgi:hypothetical protein
MVEAAKHLLTSFDELLNSFDRLPASHRVHVAREMLVKLKQHASNVPDWDGDMPPLDEETMARLGDELFQMLDQQEREHGAPEAW